MTSGWRVFFGTAMIILGFGWVGICLAIKLLTPYWPLVNVLIFASPGFVVAVAGILVRGAHQ